MTDQTTEADRSGLGLFKCSLFPKLGNFKLVTLSVRIVTEIATPSTRTFTKVIRPCRTMLIITILIITTSHRWWTRHSSLPSLAWMIPGQPPSAYLKTKPRKLRFVNPTNDIKPFPNPLPQVSSPHRSVAFINRGTKGKELWVSLKVNKRDEPR